MNYDNLFMFQSHPRSLMQVFRTGGKINFFFFFFFSYTSKRDKNYNFVLMDLEQQKID